MEPNQKEIKTFDGKLIVTVREVKHSKSGKMQPYISFSNGQDVAGVYIDENTLKELSKFFKIKKEGKDD